MDIQRDILDRLERIEQKQSIAVTRRFAAGVWLGLVVIAILVLIINS